MVIDGLPAEFVLGRGDKPPTKAMMEAMPYTQSLLSGGKAQGYYAKAAPPTVTMPRFYTILAWTMWGILVDAIGMLFRNFHIGIITFGDFKGICVFGRLVQVYAFGGWSRITTSFPLEKLVNITLCYEAPPQEVRNLIKLLLLQVDIAPTLALLFGVPIPKNNIGVLLRGMFDTLTDYNLRAHKGTLDVCCNKVSHG
ncbi:hypothetical protein B296_00022888 [Ensete ventricosum]|uniref:Uncharacterized protein n=1 Tax=Ensete ventricosum TaxID=4639 RepID=A0A427A7Q2_ENSVE|nr:hypothetical protein B296_00022888 [Ensete ventricosum]